MLNMMEKDNIFKLYAIKTGEVYVTAPKVYWMEGRNKWEKSSFHAILLKGKN